MSRPSCSQPSSSGGTAQAQRASLAASGLSTFQSQEVPSRALTLDEVIDLAEARSEQIAIAQFGVTRAVAGEQRARSDRLPQLAGGASYDRTLKSEFEGIFSGGAGDGGFGGDFSELPFGQPNAFRLNLAFSQAVYAGGRIDAQQQLAVAGRSVADASLKSARAQLVLDATQAFYDAALTDRLVAIAEASLQQAEATLAQVELAYKAGRSPEFDALRARVARDNQRPNVIRAKANRTIAYLRLKQLLEIPASQPVTVSAELDDAALDPPSRFAAQLAEVTAVSASQTAAGRVPVQQATSAVQAREAALRITKSQRRPYVSVNSALGEVAYAGLPGFDDWRTNWTVGASVQIPLFTGGRSEGGGGRAPERTSARRVRGRSSRRSCPRPRRRRRSPCSTPRSPPGRRAPAPWSRRFARMTSRTCATARAFRRSWSCWTPGWCCSPLR